MFTEQPHPQPKNNNKNHDNFQLKPENVTDKLETIAHTAHYVLAAFNVSPELIITQHYSESPLTVT